MGAKGKKKREKMAWKLKKTGNLFQWDYLKEDGMIESCVQEGNLSFDSLEREHVSMATKARLWL